MIVYTLFGGIFFFSTPLLMYISEEYDIYNIDEI